MINWKEYVEHLIQHGKYNDRIYLLELNPLELPALFKQFKILISKNQYSKIIAKVPEKYRMNFFVKDIKKKHFSKFL